MGYSEELELKIDELRIKNNEYNDLLTLINNKKNELDEAKKNKESQLSKNRLNYNIGCIIAILFECFAPLGGVEDWLGLFLIFIFSGVFQTAQAKVRKNILDLEKDLEEKMSNKDELYNEVSILRSLVHEKKREEDKLSYQGISNIQNIVYDKAISLKKRFR